MRIERRKRVATHIALILFSSIIVIPFLWLFIISFKDNAQIFNTPLKMPESWSLINYFSAWDRISMPMLLKNTLYVAVFSTSIMIVLSFLAAYLIVRLPFRLSNGLYLLFLCGLAIPGAVLMHPIGSMTYKLGLYDSLWGLILPYVGWCFPFNILVFTGFIRGLPTDMEEASVIDGCGLWKMLWHIVVPLCKPVLMTVTVFNFLTAFNEYTLALVLTNSYDNAILSLGMGMFRTNFTVDYGEMAAAAVMIVVIELVIYSAFQKYIVGGLTAGAVKG